MTTYNSVSYSPITPVAGLQPISSSSSTQNHAIGFRVQAEDATYGTGEFVYMPGVASTAVGSVVLLDMIGQKTTLAVHSTAGRGVLAVAMSANGAGSYGWYQIEGANPNVLSTGTTAVGSKVYLTSTAGEVSSSVVATDGVDGAIFTVATSNGVCGVQLANPSATGNG